MFVRDKELLRHYKDLKCNNRMYFMVNRMKDCKKEINSLEEMLKE